MNIRQLQNLDPAGWTELLALDEATRGAVVTSVDAERMEEGRHLIRYWLTLAGHEEPVTFVGKKTTAAEALFYSTLAPELPRLAGHGRFTDVLGAGGWVIMDDVPQDRPVLRWSPDSQESAVRGLAHLHATFWDQESFLQRYSWLPHYRTSDASVASLRYELKVATLVSDHAVRSAGRFATPLLRAGTGLRALERLDEWPQVFDERHRQAIADLLDDPLPMLQPLRELPPTLLHGNVLPHHWHLTLFGGVHLFDWQSLYVGPAPLDLVQYLESIDYMRARNSLWPSRRDQQLFDETSIDSYLLAMSQELDQRFSARDVRQAIGAARCLYLLTRWLPFMADWEEKLHQNGPPWSKLREMDEEALRSAGRGQMAETRAYLQQVFNRLLLAYRTL